MSRMRENFGYFRRVFVELVSVLGVDLGCGSGCWALGDARCCSAIHGVLAKVSCTRGQVEGIVPQGLRSLVLDYSWSTRRARLLNLLSSV